MSEPFDEAGWDLPTPCTLDIQVGGDVIDGLGHVNNTAYTQWCEKVSWTHSGSLGITLETYHQLRRAMVIRTTTYEYLLASYQGEQVRAATWVVSCDEIIRVVRRFQLRRLSDGKTLLRARTHYVCVDLDTGGATTMPELFAKAYGGAAIDDSHLKLLKA